MAENRTISCEKIREYRNTMEVAIENHIQATKVTPGHAEAELRPQTWQENQIHSVHGGVLVTLADFTAGCASMSYGEYTTTMSCSVNFLNAAIEEPVVTAAADVEKRGRKTQVFRVVLRGSDGKVILVSSFTFFSLEKPVQIPD